MQKSGTILSGLYGITDEWLMSGQNLFEKAEAVLRGGCAVLQYRNKQSDIRQRTMEATRLRQLCNQYHACFIVNDDPSLALAVEADGLHIGQQDFPLRRMREEMPDHWVIGVSCHGELSLALQAQQQGADYVAFGRFFDSLTKPQARGADLSVLSRAKQQLHVPIVAIGGITGDNAPLVIKQGADMIAVIHDLFAPDNIETVEAKARQFVSLFD
jgi:thiamine-phosphate pyrophosphorylase